MKRYLINCNVRYNKFVLSTVNAVYAVDLMKKLVETYDPDRSNDKASFSLEIVDDDKEEEEEEEF